MRAQPAGSRQLAVGSWQCLGQLIDSVCPGCLALTLGAGGYEVEGAILAAQILAGAIDPHVGGLHNVIL